MPKSAPPPSEPVHVGRRVVLGLFALAGVGFAVGGSLQRTVNKVASGFNLGGGFRLYTITGTYPTIRDKDYRLKVEGLVDRPTVYTLADLKALPSIHMVKTFQCVTGWTVPDVEWRGVRLSHLLELAGVQEGGHAVTFDSYDGADTESLTIDQAHLPDVIVAYEMLGKPVTTPHGGPVRLYVAPMFGYKSLKWLSAIRVVPEVQPGYWEQNGYPTNAWLDGTTGPTDPDPQLT